MRQSDQKEPLLQKTTLYGAPLSGHAHRVEALLRLLNLPYTYTVADPAMRKTRAFLSLNPLGQIPVLVDGDLVIADSSAILVYLAKRYDDTRRWYPEDPVGAASVQRWLALAAGELRFGPATARAILLWGRPGDLASAQQTGDRLLRFMDGHLSGRKYLAAKWPTVADLACYAYVARAPEGGIKLEPFAEVRAWLARLETMPELPKMPESTPTT